MTRLLALAACGSIIFSGFFLAVVLDGKRGVVTGAAVVIIGAALFWILEKRSRHSLESESSLNRVLKADGENLVERK